MTWQLLNFSATRSASKAKLAETKIDASAKDFIQAAIDKLPDGCTSVQVNGYSQEVKDSRQPGRFTTVIQITVTGNTI